MKRLRHYDKDLAVVLSVFGSSEPSAMEQYKALMEEIKKDLSSEVELRLAISSRTVLKKLEQQGNHYCTLAENLANLDRLGYRKVIVVSVNLFSTEEHEYLSRTVNAFRNISDRYELTSPFFSKAKLTKTFLEHLSDKLRSKYNIPNIIFIAHGAPNLNICGNQTFSYVRDYLGMLNPRNQFYCIEGSYPYNKDFVMGVIERENHYNKQANDVLVVPLLLVSGNHAKNDIQEIKNELSSEFNEVKIPENFLSEGDFSLLKLQEVRDYFREEVQNAIKRFEW